MSDTAVLSSEPQTEEEYRTEFRRLLSEMEMMNRRMDEARKGSDQIKAETQRLKRETRAILASMGVKL